MSAASGRGRGASGPGSFRVKHAPAAAVVGMRRRAREVRLRVVRELGFDACHRLQGGRVCSTRSMPPARRRRHRLRASLAATCATRHLLRDERHSRIVRLLPGSSTVSTARPEPWPLAEPDALGARQSTGSRMQGMIVYDWSFDAQCRSDRGARRRHARRVESSAKYRESVVEAYRQAAPSAGSVALLDGENFGEQLVKLGLRPVHPSFAIGSRTPPRGSVLIPERARAARARRSAPSGTATEPAPDDPRQRHKKRDEPRRDEQQVRRPAA